jgi:hypothetical protein
MTAMPVKVTVPLTAPANGFTPPTRFTTPTKMHQNDQVGETIAIRGLLPLCLGSPHKLSKKQQQQQRAAFNHGFPVATPLRSTLNGGPNDRPEAPETKEAFCQGCVFGFSAATSLAAMGRSVIPAQQGVGFTPMTSTVQPMTVSSMEERRDWHAATPDIFSLGIDVDLDLDLFEW